MSKTYKNILFRSDSSSTIGTGHIMRDLVLASGYKDSNIVFATQDLDGNINHKIKEAGYKIEILKSNSLKEIIELVEKYNIDMVVIDHYGIDSNYEKKLKNKTGVKILSFDDTYEKHYCDILLNHNISANKKRYKDLVPKSCTLRCGSKYTLLRDEFYKIKKDIKKDIKNKKTLTVFISMGGTDNININIQILDKISNFNNLKVIILSTTANKNLNILQKYVENKSWIDLHINSNNVADLINNSDFAIVTPSVTVNEVCFMNLPFIAIKIADNQKDVYEYLQKEFLTLDYLGISQLNDKINYLIKNYSMYLEKTEKEFHEKR